MKDTGLSLRDRIMDKFWLEFLEECSHDLYSKYGRRLDATFWYWFQEEKVRKLRQPLEDFLK